MIWVIALIAGIALGIWLAYDIGYSWGSYIGYPILLTMASTLVAMLIALFCSIEPVPVERAELINTTEIVAMEDGIAVKGYYRRVEAEGKFWVLIETDSGVHMTSYDADKTYIQYTNGAPRIETYTNKPISCFRTFLFTKHWFETTKYIIFVPNESEITDDFVVDLE